MFPLRIKNQDKHINGANGTFLVLKMTSFFPQQTFQIAEMLDNLFQKNLDIQKEDADNVTEGHPMKISSNNSKAFAALQILKTEKE